MYTFLKIVHVVTEVHVDFSLQVITQRDFT
jgi:hypothetical protein